MDAEDHARFWRENLVRLGKLVLGLACGAAIFLAIGYGLVSLHGPDPKLWNNPEEHREWK